MLAETRHQFPLGKALDAEQTHEVTPTEARRPFGLKYAIEPPTVADIDLTAIGYDPVLQIAVLDDGGALVPAMRHTSTQTKTQTGDRSGPDSDTDATGT